MPRDRLHPFRAAAVLLPALIAAAAGPALAGLEDLVVEREARTFLGVTTSGGRSGVRVLGVEAGSAAEAAGLQAGDTIVALDDMRIARPGGLRGLLREQRPGDVVSLTVMREGERIRLDATLGTREMLTLALDEEFFVWGPEFHGHVTGKMVLNDPGDLQEIYLCEGASCRYSQEPVWYRLDCLDDGCPSYRIDYTGRPALGVQLTRVSPELRRHFGADADVGVLVGKVFPESAAERAGIHVGDLIVAMDGEPIAEAGDIRRALRGKREERVDVEVLREGRTMHVEARIPDPVQR